MFTNLVFFNKNFNCKTFEYVIKKSRKLLNLGNISKNY